MPHFLSMYDANYIYAFDLQDRDLTLTIREVVASKVKDSEGKEQKKPIVYFKEPKDGRGLVLCKTNGKTIAAMYGSKTEEWIGRRITLFPTETSAFGKTVDCIRIRPQKPPASRAAGELAEARQAPAPEAPEHAGLDEA